MLRNEPLRRNGNRGRFRRGTPILASDAKGLGMTLGTKLKQHIGDRKQQEVAAAWLERWEGQTLKLDTVESRLSNCVNDRDEGVRFFFEERTRAAALFDVLSVPDASRKEMLALADAVLSGSHQAPRAVIDLGRFDANDVRELSSGVVDQIVEHALWPATLIVTDAQFPTIPRTIEEEPRKLRIERLADAVECESRARELAGDHAVVIAPWRFELHRWIALGRSPNEVAMHPRDGVAAFAREGRLSVPTCGRPTVSDLGFEAESDVEEPSDPIDVRELLCTLGAVVESSPVPPGRRRALGALLGVEVAATVAEVREHELSETAAQIGFPLDTSGGAPARDALLSRASSRPVDPKTFRIGDTLHVVVPDTWVSSDGAMLLEHPRVAVHAFQVRQPALVRLRDEVCRMTRFQLAEDPLLEHTIARLDPRGEARLPFALARAALFEAGHVEPNVRDAELVDDWRGALEAAIGRTMPDIWLRVFDLQERAFRASTFAAPELDTMNFSVKGRVVVSKEHPTLSCIESRSPISNPFSRSGDARFEVLVDHWFSVVDEWATRRNGQPTIDPRFVENRPKAEAARDWENEDLPRLARSTWLALLRACRSSEWVVDRDGRVQVHVGSGICLDLTVARHVRPDGATEPRLALDCGMTRAFDRWNNTYDQRVVTHRLGLGPKPGPYDVGYTVPLGALVTTGEYAIEVAFAFAPWMGGGESLALHDIVARKRRHDEEEAEEEARRAYDD